MERIFLSRISGLLILLFTCSLSFGQNNYYVFKKDGKPSAAGAKILERGSPFLESDTLYLQEKDYVLFVNEIGELFEIDKPNIYAFSAIADYKKILETDSFTEKYFAYVWKQFTNKLKKKQEAGVVYREERKVELLAPMDSVKFYNPEVRFEWKNTTDVDQLYFFFKDLETGHLTKIGVTGTTLILNIDQYLLKPGQAYDWSVSALKFPNLNELKFNRLNILSKTDYEQLEKEMAALIKAFTYLGFSEAEIQEAICLDYKFCTS